MTTLTVFLQISELIAPLAMVGTVVTATLKAVAKPMGLPTRRDKSEQKPILEEGEGAKECRPGSLCRELERNEIPNRRTKLRALSVRSETHAFAAPSRGRGAGVLVATGSMTVFPRIPNAETKVSYQPVSSTTLLKGNQRSFRAHLVLLVERAREGNGRRK